jgi:hypothetical protein
MPAVAFGTLRLAQRLTAAGLPPHQAREMASAPAETIGEGVTREYLGLRLGQLRADLDLRLGELRTEIAEIKAGAMKRMIGTIGLQTAVIIGAVAALIRLFH